MSSSILAIHDRHHNPQAVFAAVFNPRAREIRRCIHVGLHGRLHYVVSSTWRQSLSQAQMAEAFALGGLDFVASNLHHAWCTPTPFKNAKRADDTAAWLDHHHQGQAFAVRDDVFSGASLKRALESASHPFHGRVALCEEYVGLCEEHLAPSIEALVRPPVLPRGAAGDAR